MMDHQFRNYIRSDSLGLTPRELLQARPIVLLGVSAEADERLRTIEIFSVFDLAMSHVFDAARRLSGTSDEQSDFHRLGIVPADQVSAATRRNRSTKCSSSRSKRLSASATTTGQPWSQRFT